MRHEPDTDRYMLSTSAQLHVRANLDLEIRCVSTPSDIYACTHCTRPTALVLSQPKNVPCRFSREIHIQILQRFYFSHRNYSNGIAHECTISFSVLKRKTVNRRTYIVHIRIIAHYYAQKIKKQNGLEISAPLPSSAPFYTTTYTTCTQQSYRRFTLQH